MRFLGLLLMIGLIMAAYKTNKPLDNDLNDFVKNIDKNSKQPNSKKSKNKK